MSKSKFIITLASLLAIPSVAQADWKGYAGANCIGETVAPGLRHQPRGLVNASNARRRVICPVVRDVMDGGEGQIRRIRIRLVNNNANEGGWCRYYSKYASGGIVNVAHRNFNGTGLKTLTFEDIDTPDIGHVVIQCSLPRQASAQASGRSYIVSYAVDEEE